MHRLKELQYKFANSNLLSVKILQIFVQKYTSLQVRHSQKVHKYTQFPPFMVHNFYFKGRESADCAETV
jgi:hypothetical protein